MDRSEIILEWLLELIDKGEICADQGARLADTIEAKTDDANFMKFVIWDRAQPVKDPNAKRPGRPRGTALTWRYFRKDYNEERGAEAIAQLFATDTAKFTIRRRARIVRALINSGILNGEVERSALFGYMRQMEMAPLRALWRRQKTFVDALNFEGYVIGKDEERYIAERFMAIYRDLERDEESP